MQPSAPLLVKGNVPMDDTVPAWVKYRGSCGCIITYKATQFHLSKCATHGEVSLKIIEVSKHTISTAKAVADRRRGQRLNEARNG